MYREINPSIKIDPTVESFWHYKGNGEQTAFKILPDSCVDLIFDLHQKKGFISGLMTEYQNLKLEANPNLIGIRFRAEIFSFLFQLPLKEIKNQKLDLSILNSEWAPMILAKLNHSESLADSLNYLENFIHLQLNNPQYQADETVLNVTNSIRSLKGNVNIQKLAKSNLISLRQLERRFKKCIGTTIKEFSNIIRFIHAKKAIANNQQDSLLEIAFDSGYYDHAHMNANFKRMAGENPSRFR